MTSSESSDELRRSRFVATYSIVARDAATGEMGVAVQSHYFAVGAVVPWLEPGVGAIASQASGEPGYGAFGLGQLRAGKDPQQALDALLADDPRSDVRQVAFVDASGRVAVHTGSMCIAAAGHHVGEGYSAQGNMLRCDAVWPAMAEAFEGASGVLATRLLAALDAGEAAGGDVRGRQSAALRVVTGERSGRPWEETPVDIRVDDHPEPLAELRRLLDFQFGRSHFDRAEAAMQSGDQEAAFREVAKALELCGDNPEFGFWAGVALASGGRVDEALPLLRAAYQVDPGWRELLRRIPEAGLFPLDAELAERLASE